MNKHFSRKYLFIYIRTTETDPMITCINCNVENAPLAKYCNECSNMLRCPSCSIILTGTSTITSEMSNCVCKECGFKLLSQNIPIIVKNTTMQVHNIITFNDTNSHLLQAVKNQALAYLAKTLIVVPYNCHLEPNIANFVNSLSFIKEHNSASTVIALIGFERISSEKSDVQFIKSYFPKARVFGYRIGHSKPFKFY